MSKKPRSKKSIIESAIETKYRDSGWQIVKIKSSINDYIAYKDQKLHFIQIYVPDDARHEQLAKNTFIQNAFSNNAVPVYITATSHKSNDNLIEIKLDLSNVNTNTKVILSRKPIQKNQDVSTKAPK